MHTWAHFALVVEEVEEATERTAIQSSSRFTVLLLVCE